MMTKTFRFALSAMTVFFLLWACNKEINLITNVEYDVETQYTEGGFTQEALATEIKLMPEVLDYPGFEYYLQYEVLSGEGYFVNTAKERVPDMTEMQLDATSEYTVNWNYIGTKPGKHSIKLYTRDNFEKQQVYKLVYDIKPVDVTWTATTAVTEAKAHDTIPIVLNLVNTTADFATEFTYSINLAEGSGRFIDATNKALEIGSSLAIQEGQTTIRFIPDAIGTARLNFGLRYYDGIQKTALLNIAILETAANLAPIAVAVIPNDGVNKGEAPFAVTFDGSGSTDDGSISAYQWDFGDGSPIATDATVTHTFDTVGEYIVTLQVTDDLGVVNTNTDTNTIRIFVEEDMQSDFMAIDDAFTIENAADTTILVLDNDQIPTGTTATITSVTQPANGAVTIAADGSIRYTPNTDFVGKDSFSYTISDENGVTSSAAVILTVTITNEAPTVVDDTATTEENAPVTIAVLENDNDPENKPLIISNTTTPANGILVVNTNGTITYTPNTGFFGEDQFDYTINDGIAGNDATATVILTVEDINQAPVAVDSQETMTDIEEKSINVLDNVTDEENDLITIVSATALNGTVVDNGDGTITFTPVFGLGAVDQITYTVNDGTVGNDATATIRIDITRADMIPISNIGIERELIAEGDDTLGIEDGMMLRSDAEKITVFGSSAGGDFGFLRYFVNLKELRFSRSARVDDLDFTNLSKLELIDGFQTDIPKLDLTGAVNLKKISLKQTAVEEIDLSTNLLLEEIDFDIGAINLTGPLDLSNNIKLEGLIIYSNTYPAIIFNNPNLKKVLINSFAAQSLDLSKSINLEDVKITGQELVRLNLKNGNNTKITSLSLTLNKNATCIAVDNIMDAEEKTRNGEWVKDETGFYAENCR